MAVVVVSEAPRTGGFHSEVSAIIAEEAIEYLRAPIVRVTGFDAPLYMGRWYEIARLNHRFERGMSDVTADYSLNEDGSVRVINSGTRNGRRKSVEGTARFKGDPDVASLAVSFFPGFPGGYHVFALDEGYQWAMISGPDRGYLWILSRQPGMEEELYRQLVGIARDRGFPVEGLIRVEQREGARA